MISGEMLFFLVGQFNVKLIRIQNFSEEANAISIDLRKGVEYQFVLLTDTSSRIIFFLIKNLNL